MKTFNNIWKSFLTEGDFGQGTPPADEESKELYKKHIIKLENKERLLKELSEDELEHIRAAIDDMPGEDMAFDKIFDGKMRLILDFPTFDATTELGKFVKMWEILGYTVDWEKGTIEGQRELVDLSPAGMTQTILNLGIPDPSRKTKKIKMKIGKFLSKMIEYRTKFDVLKKKIEDKTPNTVTGYTGTEIEAALSEEELKNYYRLSSHIDMMVDHPFGPVMPQELRSVGGLQELARYWQKNADYIKKNLDKATGNQYSIILTRNPIDILRMSDFEDITSCHSPPSRGGGDSYYKCAVAEAHGHGAVAYVVKTDNILENYGEDVTLEQVTDSREFQDDEVFYDETRERHLGALSDAADGWIQPVSRLRLRQVRYYSAEEQESLLAKYGKIDDLPDDLSDEEMKALFMRIKRAREKGFNPYDGVQIAVPESRVYGASIPGFHKRIMAWAQENQNEQLEGAPRDTSRPYGDKWGDEPWQFGTIDLNNFIKFGGSYEDTSISNLVGLLFGKKAQVSGTVKRDETTEEELDVNLVSGLVERYQAQCDEITERVNEMMAMAAVDGDAVEDGDGGVYISCEASITIIWEEDDWKTWPDINLISYALEQLQEYGFPWVKSDYPNQFGRKGGTGSRSTHRYLRIDVAPEKLAGWGGQEYAYAPDDYEDFCEHIDTEVDEKREPIKFLLTNFFKREGAMKGGGVMHLGNDVMNDNLDLYHWEAHAEEGYEIDEFEFVNFTAHPEVFYADLGADPDTADQIFADRNYWLGIRHRMAAPAFENTGMDHYPEMPLDIDLLGWHGTEGESQELNLMFSVHEESSDEQAAVLRNLVEIWDDQDKLNKVASEVFQDIIQDKATLSGTQVGSGAGGYAESYKAEEAQILKVERLLAALNG